SGVMHSVAPSDAQQQDTYFVVAHIHYVLFGGAIFALFAGAYYWFPKITGRMLHEGLGKLHFWLMFVGMNLAFFPMHFLGLWGMPRRIYTYPAGMGWDLANFLSTIGAFVIALSILVFLHNVVRSYRRGERASADPWDGRTLEWSIPSPPPAWNFEAIPAVHSRDPWWEQKQRRAVAAPVGAISDGPVHRNDGGTSDGPVASSLGSSDAGHHGIHMPSPSYWPIVVPLGITIAAYGLVYHLALSGIGLAVALAGIYGWAFEPASKAEGS
ncbi:MAG: cytochrome c oxidase subunit 4, partial [Chloroflexi bacterium]|nr:cytochrome c oxidase subunit 4 [Chloroflexota bacterium]